LTGAEKDITLFGMTKKRGPGRPSLARGKTPVTSLKLPKELRDGVDEIAAELGISFGEVVREALRLRLNLWQFMPPGEVAIKIMVDPWPDRKMTDSEVREIAGPNYPPEPGLTLLLNDIQRRP
jgi:Ribbon-helix-helix protein, copG family